MHDHVAVIQHEPALVGLTIDAAPFLVILFGGFQHPFGERVQHAVAGAIADDEVICK